MQSTLITEKSRKLSYWRLIAAMLIGWYLMSCALNTNFSHFIDNVDLIIHEAGHWIFIFFGQFIYVLGGSLNQVLIPAIFFGYFFFRREYFSASILLMWVGYNVVNVSYYMADSIVMQLPLLGGDSSIHDWNYLLTNSHLLMQTHLLSTITLDIGMFILIAGIVGGLFFSVIQEEKIVSDL